MEIINFFKKIDSLSSPNMEENRTEYCFYAQRKIYYCLSSHYVTLKVLIPSILYRALHPVGAK